MLRKGRGGIYKAPTREKRRMRKAKKREREIRSSLFIFDFKVAFYVRCVLSQFFRFGFRDALNSN